MDPRLDLPTTPSLVELSVALHPDQKPMNATLQSANEGVNISKPIKYIQEERQLNLNRLDPKDRERIAELERDIDKLKPFALECYRANDLFQESEKNLSKFENEQPQDKQAIVDAEKKFQETLEYSQTKADALETCFQQLDNQYKELLPPNPFMGWGHLNTVDLPESERAERLNFFKEQLLNSVVNRRLLAMNIKATFDQHMETIAATFFHDIPFNRIELFPVSGETHNGGKLQRALFVTTMGKR